MARQLYELKHPLYPHPDLLKYHQDHKMTYLPYQGSYDDTYRNWYQLVRADHDISGAPKRPIYREISQIIRTRSSGKEYILYSETLYGTDHENNQITFFHTVGTYKKPSFKTTYNYDTKQAFTLPSGQVETIYWIPFDKNLIDELYEAGSEEKDIELLINVGPKQYGGRGFFSYDEFRNSSFEELARIGREGKGMFTLAQTQIPAGTMANELKAAAGTGAGGVQQLQPPPTQALWKEFLEFQKFKQQQQQSQQQQQQKRDK